ncbi:MAG: hypothetical protein ACK4V6_11615 [Microthrixaceae bacterium]
MNDLMQQLHDSRPTDAELNQMWPTSDRDRVLGRIQKGRTPATTTRTRRRTAWLASAAAIAAVVLVPNVIDTGAAEAGLTDLAMAAVTADGPIIAEGTYLHVKTEAVQRNSSLFGDGKTRETNRESWIRWDGKIWAIDTRPSAGWREYHLFTQTEAPSINQPTPKFAASLPRNAKALGEYLHENVQGSNSHEEAIFVAVTDLASSNFLPPETLAAGLEVLAEVDGVETKDVVVRGRPGVEISFNRFFFDIVAKQTYTLDKATARVIAVEDSDPTGTYERETTLVEVVDRIPQEVLDTYANVEHSTRIYDDEHSPTPQSR